MNIEDISFSRLPFRSPPLPPAIMSDTSLTSRRYIDGIYIPVGLLVVGTYIVKKEWTPYAVLLALVLGAWKYVSSRRFYCAIFKLEV